MEKCQKCSRGLSNAASYCPYCGFPVPISFLKPPRITPGLCLSQISDDSWWEKAQNSVKDPESLVETQQGIVVETDEKIDIEKEKVREKAKEIEQKILADIEAAKQEIAAVEKELLDKETALVGEGSVAVPLDIQESLEAVDDLEASQYIPLPGGKEALKDIEEELPSFDEIVESSSKENKLPSDELFEEAFSEVGKDVPVEDVSKEPGEVSIEWAKEYPEIWQWLVFEDEENLEQGYRVVGLVDEGEKGDKLVFVREKETYTTVFALMGDEEKDEIITLLKKGEFLASMRKLRRRFKHLKFQDIKRILKRAARLEGVKVPKKIRMEIEKRSGKEKKQVLKLVKEGRALDAIYLFRRYSKLDLSTSREQVEYLCEMEGVVFDPTLMESKYMRKVRKKSSRAKLIWSFVGFFLFGLIIFFFFVLSRS